MCEPSGSASDTVRGWQPRLVSLKVWQGCHPVHSTRALGVAKSSRNPLLFALGRRTEVHSLYEKSRIRICAHPPMQHVVIIHRLSLLQRAADLVRTGHYHHATGVVDADKAMSWARKAERYYAVLLDRNRRSRAKARGEGSAYLLLHEIEAGRLLWVLLVSDGDHPAHRLERLRHALDPTQRLELFEYELVRMTKEGFDRPVWTWRMSAETYEALRTRVIDTVRRGDVHTVRQLIASLYRSAGFRAVRSQVGKTVALLRAEWKRRRGTEPLPRLPRLLPYVQRLRIETIPLAVWLSAQKRNTTSEQARTVGNAIGTGLPHSTSGSG
jgi:hypothetical protein